ncbi:MAG: DUF3047 domain-containing protein [Kordiimonadaceae bacterium]|nr:DUF3047 domain-containing protein [Kordiimonadaceae bacterium]
MSVMDFSEALTLDPVPDGWHHRTFWRHSPMDISFITKDERPSIRLSTDNTASMLFRYVDIQLNQYPFLSWEWFIEQGIYSDLSELTPEGDDHPARFYLSFEAENGDTHRMEIIWGNKELHRGDWKHLKFSETRSFPHYVANGGEENIGQWHAEKVDLTELYQTLWGSAKGAKLKEIALFCDTDETDLKSIAYFSNIGIEKATSN